MLVRFVLLFAIAGALIIFTWSNLQPVAITFLGIQTLEFPLALWVLGAIAAGILTTLVINILFSISNFATGREVRAQFRQTTRSRFEHLRRDRTSSPSSTTDPGSSYTQSGAAKKEDDAVWKNWDGYEEPVSRPQTPRQPSPATASDDWDLELRDWEDTPANAPVDRQGTTSAAKSRTDYEVTQQPKSSSQSGSVYSYGYRDPGGSGVGKQEKVVDAEYRVIIPPYIPSVPSPTPAPMTPPPTEEREDEDNADDWFNEDDSDRR